MTGEDRAWRNFFAGKHVLIVGASSGIGREIALLLASEAAAISLVARGENRLNQVASKCLRSQQPVEPGKRRNGSNDFGNDSVAPTTVFATTCDCSDAVSVDEMVARVVDQSGPVHVLINAAGGAQGVYFENLDATLAESQMKGNYFCQLYPAKAVFAHMKENGIRGNIALVSSMAGLTGVFGMTAYSPAKFAVRGLAECLYFEGIPHGIQITTIYPPDTDTDGYANEKKTMPAETQEITGSAGLFQADKVARHTLRGIARGQFRVMSGMDGKLLGIVTAGMTPGASFAEFCLMSILRAVSPIYNRGFRNVILRHHQTKSSNASSPKSD